jgi:hypothetical protein
MCFAVSLCTIGNRSSTMSSARIATALILAALLMEGCSGGGDAPGGKGAAAPAVGGGQHTSFSAVINGKQIKGDRASALGTSNQASITPPGSEIIEMIFALAPTSNDESAVPELSLRFNFPVKQASYELQGTDIASCNNCSVVLSQEVAPYAQYSPQKLLVSITSLSADRVAGTFSGTLQYSFQTPDNVRKLAPPVMRIENGQFDIPIAHP